MARRRSIRSGLEQRFLANLRAGGVDACDRLIIGFSGGIDSLALALLAKRVQPLLRTETLLVYVDHRLRSDSGDAALAAEGLARQVGLPFRVNTLDSGLAERSKGIGIEETARRERYLRLAETAAYWDASAILLGHQANDQAETVLLHIFRGSGLEGISGMKMAEECAIPWWPSSQPSVGVFSLIRPLLGELREELSSYVSLSGLVPVEDPTNEEPQFDRNWLRLEVLPKVLQRWPGAFHSIGNLAALAAADVAFIDGIMTQAEVDCAESDRTLCTDTLSSLPVPVANRVIMSWLGRLGSLDITRDVVARCYRAAFDTDEDWVIEVGNGISVVRSGKRLMTLADLQTEALSSFPMAFDDGIQEWDITLSPSLGISPLDRLVPAKRHPTVRTIRPGDRWAGTNRAVADDLRLARIHPLLRPHLLAVVDEDGVLLIPAIYPTIRALRAEEADEWLEVQWQRTAQRPPPG